MIETLLMLGFVFRDELRDFGVCSYGLDQNDVVSVEEHAIRSMHFIAAANQDAIDSLSFLINLALNVVNIGEFRVFGIGIGQLAEINLIVVEQNGSIGSGDFGSLGLAGALASNCGDENGEQEYRSNELFQRAPPSKVMGQRRDPAGLAQPASNAEIGRCICCLDSPEIRPLVEAAEGHGGSSFIAKFW